VRVHIHLGEQEQLLGLQPELGDVNGGTSVNGVLAPPSPFVVEKGDKIY
jgi:hypothetical protein